MPSLASAANDGKSWMVPVTRTGDPVGSTVGPASIDTLYWSSPASQKAQWDAAVSLTANAFQPGDVATSH